MTRVLVKENVGDAAVKLLEDAGFDVDLGIDWADGELEERIVELGQEEELRALRPDLTGNQVMELLEVGPGPVIGRALAFLMELRLDEGPLCEEEAGRRLLEWWRTQG